MPPISQAQEVEALSGRIPLPLAVPLQGMATEADPRLALWSAAELAEMVMRFVVAVGTAEHAALPPPLALAIRKNIEQPTLGRWMTMARSVADELATNSAFPELKATAETWLSLLGNPSAGPQASLLDLRNRLAHAGPMGMSEATALWESWKPRLMTAALQSFKWLEATELRATDRNGASYRLTGQTPVLVSPAAAAASEHGARLVRGANRVDIEPLQIFDTASRSLNVYFRHSEPKLQYIRLGAQSGMCDSDAATAARFHDRFLRHSLPIATGQLVPGFEAEFERLGKRLIGRQRELTTLVGAIHAQQAGQLIWVWGAPGMGKSILLAAAYSELSATAQSCTPFAYRFRTGDERCRREPFLRFLAERFASHSPDLNDAVPLPNLARPWGQLLQLIQSLLSKRRCGDPVVVFIDGIDEIAAADKAIVDEVLLPLTRTGVRIVIAGRPVAPIHAALRGANSVEPFPDGLPRLEHNEVRAMVLQHLPTLRHRLLKPELLSDNGDNPLIAAICQRADGLPIYVMRAIDGLRDGSISPDAPLTLPSGMFAFHERLTTDAQAGTDSMLRGPILALLASSFEPLTASDLSSLLKRWMLIDDRDAAGEAQVEGALAGLLPCLTAESDETTRERTRYSLYHETFREFLQTSPSTAGQLRLVQKLFSANAQSPLDPFDAYLTRHGARHLLESGDLARASKVLCNFEISMFRLGYASKIPSDAVGWLDDWAQLRSARLDEGADRDWDDVATELRQRLGLHGWLAHQLLFQIAASARPGSAPHGAALAFARENTVDWPWAESVAMKPLGATDAARQLGRAFQPVGSLRGEKICAFGPVKDGWFFVGTNSGKLFACAAKAGDAPRLVAELTQGTEFQFNERGDTLLVREPGRGISIARLASSATTILNVLPAASPKRVAMGADRLAVLWQDGSVTVYANSDGAVIPYPPVEFKPNVIAISGSSVVVAATAGLVACLQPTDSSTPSTRLNLYLNPDDPVRSLIGDDVGAVGTVGRFTILIVNGLQDELWVHDGDGWKEVDLSKARLSGLVKVALLDASCDPNDGALCLQLGVTSDAMKSDIPHYCSVRWYGADVPVAVSTVQLPKSCWHRTPPQRSLGHDSQSRISIVVNAGTAPAVILATIDFPTRVQIAADLGEHTIAVADELGNLRVLSNWEVHVPSILSSSRADARICCNDSDQLWVLDGSEVSLFTTGAPANRSGLKLDANVMPVSAIALGGNCLVRRDDGGSVLLQHRAGALTRRPGPTLARLSIHQGSNQPERLSEGLALLHGLDEAAIFSTETGEVVVRIPARFGLSVDGALVRDARRCVSWESGFVDQWDLETGQRISTHELEMEDNFLSGRLLRDGHRLLLLAETRTGGEAWIVDLDSPHLPVKAYASEAFYPNLERVGARIFNWSAQGGLDLLREGLTGRTTICGKQASQIPAEFLERRWFVRTNDRHAIEVWDCEEETPRAMLLAGPTGHQEAVRMGIPLPASHALGLLGFATFEGAAFSNDRAVMLAADLITHLKVH